MLHGIAYMWNLRKKKQKLYSWKERVVWWLSGAGLLGKLGVVAAESSSL